MLCPSTFELQLYFHQLLFQEDCKQKQLVSTLGSYSNGMHVKYTIQWLMVAWNVCTWAPELGRMKNALLAYVFYNKCRVMFDFIDGHEQGQAEQWQRMCYAVCRCVVVPEDVGYAVLVPEAVENSDPVDEALRHLVSSIFRARLSLMDITYLFTVKHEEVIDWSKVTKCQIEKGRLPMLFWEVPLKVSEAFGVRRPGWPATQLFSNEWGAFGTQEVESDSFTSACKLFRRDAVLFFQKEAWESHKAMKPEHLRLRRGNEL